MPAPEVAFRRQTAVLWPAVGVDSYGETTVGDPEEIQVRWVWGDTQVTNPQGQTVAAAATVIVAQEVAVGSRMWLGTLSEFLGTGSGGEDTEVMEVVSVSETPDIKNRVTRRELSLAFYKDDPRS